MTAAPAPSNRCLRERERVGTGNRVVVVEATGYQRGRTVGSRLGFNDGFVGLMGPGKEFQLISLFFSLLFLFYNMLSLLISREQICWPILFCKYFVITHSKVNIIKQKHN